MLLKLLLKTKHLISTSIFVRVTQNNRHNIQITQKVGGGQKEQGEWVGERARKWVRGRVGEWLAAAAGRGEKQGERAGGGGSSGRWRKEQGERQEGD